MDLLSKDKFIKLMESFSGLSMEELRNKGVLETEDITDIEELTDRRSVARILHNYLRVIKRIKDESDITEAYVLKDLFDCRICANHIAQVYLKGIMEPVDIDGLIIFDVFGKVSESEVTEYIKKTKNYCNN